MNIIARDVKKVNDFIYFIIVAIVTLPMCILHHLWEAVKDYFGTLKLVWKSLYKEEKDGRIQSSNKDSRRTNAHHKVVDT